MNEPVAASRREIRHFVRDGLGCTCPDEVFNSIRVADECTAFASADTVYDIGGRLLVAVFVPADWRDIDRRLDQIVAAGMQWRDQRGYNRCRLVIATNSADAIKHLPAAFCSLPAIDEKIHLHVIAPDLLPFDVRA
ncbi:MAG: hypothetical protein WBP02_06620 [Gammaproteobacteria bacterium]